MNKSDDRALAEHASRPLAVEPAERFADPRAARPIDRERRALRQGVVGIAGAHGAGDIGQARAEQKGRDPPPLAERVQEVQEKARVLAHRAGNVAERDNRRGAVRCGARNSRSIAPPGCSERRKLRRASMRTRRAPGAKRRVRRRSSGITSAWISLAGFLDFGRAHLREILGAQDLLFRHGEASVEIERGNRPGLVPRRLEQSVGDAARARFGPVRLALARRLRRQHRDQLFQQALALPENLERLVEQKAVLMLLDQDRMQRRVEILAVADARRLDRVSASSTAPGPSGMPVSRSARAKWTIFCASAPPPAGRASDRAVIWTKARSQSERARRPCARSRRSSGSRLPRHSMMRFHGIASCCRRP